MSTEVYVSKRPDCDVCKSGGQSVPAEYDAALRMGSWAYVCQRHFDTMAVGLGTGMGQRLIVGERPAMSEADKAAAVQDAILAGDLDTLEDIVGDGDLAEYL